MINERKVQAYCSEDISRIENYDKAIADTSQMWQCHHIRETVYTREGLIEIGEYWKRPAAELIFLTEYGHKSLHKNHLGKCHSAEAKEKMSQAKKGKPSPRKGSHHTAEARARMSASHKGKPAWNKGEKGQIFWWNNGVVCKMTRECPGPGWQRGRLKK